MSLKKHQQTGFTLVELMIATAVFGVMLLLITSGILQIGRTYYKGITETKTQDTARSILDTVSQAVQFGDPTLRYPSPYPANGIYALCVGTNRYNVQLYTQLVGGAHVLTVDQPGGGVTCDPATPSVGSGRELMTTNMRLQDLNITKVAGSSNLYNIHIRVIYGDDDLLCNPNNPPTCSPGGSMSPTDRKDPKVTCKLQVGDQFCAFSDLTTTIQKQIT